MIQVMQVYSCINVAWDQFDSITNFQIRGVRVSFLEQPVFVTRRGIRPTWQVFGLCKTRIG